MINQFWKSFAENKISHSMAHYLTTLHRLREKRGYARVSDVAEELDVKKGSVSGQIKHLKEKGLVIEDEKKHLQLTELGESFARQVLQNRSVFIALVRDVLGLSGELAETDACKIEHLLSRETSNQLLRLVKLLAADETEAASVRAKLKDFEFTCPTLAHCGVCEDECLAEVDPHGGRSEGPA
ncbi:MAG: metal-dependent transcriptional regulator [Planctomycetes bacterium]|nr:metal-dependent transcriptional regulator [Planctomycetota bacterium]